MSAWISQLIDNGIKEAQPGLIVKSLHNLLESIGISLLSWPLRALLSGSIRQMKNNGTDDIGVDSPSAIDDLFTPFHLSADLMDELLVSCPGIVLEIFSQVHKA